MVRWQPLPAPPAPSVKRSDALRMVGEVWMEGLEEVDGEGPWFLHMRGFVQFHVERGCGRRWTA